MEETKREILTVMKALQEGYIQRDLEKLDDVMELFATGDQAQVVGIGASERFIGREQIREILTGDWEYWGDVVFDIPEARIRVHGDVAWLTTTGAVIQVDSHDKAMPFYLNQMKELMENDDLDVETRMMEATHFGLRRLRERHLGMGHRWPFFFTAILVKEMGGWRFHFLQWAMPVD